MMQRSAEVKRKVIVSEQNVDITENGARNLDEEEYFQSGAKIQFFGVIPPEQC